MGYYFFIAVFLQFHFDLDEVLRQREGHHNNIEIERFLKKQTMGALKFLINENHIPFPL